MKDEIKKEVEQLAPMLVQLRGKNPFKVPSDYFNNLEQEVISTIDVDTLLLSKKDSDKSIPSDYFESLTDKVLNTVSPQESKSKIVKLWNIKLIAIAASFVAILALVAWPETEDLIPNQTYSQEITTEEAWEYLSLSEEISLVDLIDDEDLNQLFEDNDLEINIDDLLLDNIIYQLTDNQLQELL
ncbi:MAG: hypothetical protein V3V14_10355 [Saprospiraceae bacterium]